jgi:hypothetical protein
MSVSNHLRRLILAAYRVGFWLYPAEFRESNAGQMLRTAREMLAEKDAGQGTVFLLAEDLVRSLLMENLTMTVARIPQLAILLTLTTFIAGAGYVISQQVLRMSANDPQIQLAEDGASRLREGEAPAAVVPERKVDMASSLAPFVIIYDDLGRPVASSAKLDGRVPTPPRGVLDNVRSYGEERVTWQPRPGVRIASVVTRTPGGFVVAGRNMREVQIREDRVFKLAAVAWLFVNCAVLGLWLLAPLFGGSKAPQPQLMT